MHDTGPGTHLDRLHHAQVVALLQLVPDFGHLDIHHVTQLALSTKAGVSGNRSPGLM